MWTGFHWCRLPISAYGATSLQVWIQRRNAPQDKSWLHVAGLVATLLLTLLLLLVYLA